jgi:DNA-binding response OmpR family regulator
VSRERLSEAALRHPWRPEDRSIDQLIFNLRRKLSDGDRALRLIQSVRGAGYVLAQNGGLGA